MGENTFCEKHIWKQNSLLELIKMEKQAALTKSHFVVLLKVSPWAPYPSWFLPHKSYNLPSGYFRPWKHFFVNCYLNVVIHTVIRLQCSFKCTIYTTVYAQAGGSLGSAALGNGETRTIQWNTAVTKHPHSMLVWSPFSVNEFILTCTFLLIPRGEV